VADIPLCRSLSADLSGVALAKTEALAKADAFSWLKKSCLSHLKNLCALSVLCGKINLCPKKTRFTGAKRLFHRLLQNRPPAFLRKQEGGPAFCIDNLPAD